MQASSLTKSYAGKRVVDDVSFEIPRGKVTSMIGPNGAGKSTVLGIMSRLLKADSGTVGLYDKPISQWKRKDLAKYVATLSQTNETHIKLTVRELVAFGRFPYSGNRLTGEDQRIIDETMAYLELEEYENRFLDELSGGQRQRAYIAMVLAQDTQYVFLDEPTNNLDIYHASKIMRMFRKLCDERGKTIVLVLHDINYAASYSDYVGVFSGGEIVRFGPAVEVMTKEVLSSIYHVDFQVLDVQGKPLFVYF